MQWKENNYMTDEKYIKFIILIDPIKITQEIVSVQPMPSDNFKCLHKNYKNEEELIKEGYKPVSNMGLMWIKEEKKEDTK